MLVQKAEGRDKHDDLLLLDSDSALLEQSGPN